MGERIVAWHPSAVNRTGFPGSSQNSRAALEPWVPSTPTEWGEVAGASFVARFLSPYFSSTPRSVLPWGLFLRANRPRAALANAALYVCTPQSPVPDGKPGTSHCPPHRTAPAHGLHGPAFHPRKF